MKATRYAEELMTEESRTDAALVLAYAQDDDRSALEELVRRRHPQAYGYALRALGDADLAEDTAQDALVGLIRGSRRFREGAPFGPWWAAILVNATRKTARRRSNVQAREERYARSRRAKEQDPTLGAEREELAEQVRALPKRMREPVMLHFYEGLTYREVATALGLPEGTAASRIRRGLGQLKGQLATCGLAALAGSLAVHLQAIGAVEHSPVAQVTARELETSAAKATTVGLLAKALAAGAVLTLALLAVPGFFAPGQDGGGPDRGPTADRTGAGGSGDGAEAKGAETGASESAEKSAGRREGGARSAAAERADVDARPNGASPADAVAASEGGLGVRVVDADGRPVAGAEVVLQGAKREAWTKQEVRPNWNEGRTATTDAEGRVSFQQPWPDRERLVLHTRAGLRGARSEAVDPAQAPAHVELRLRPPSAPLPQTGNLLARALDPAGRSLANLVVDANWAHTLISKRGTSSVLRETVRTDGQGRFVLRDLRPGAYRDLRLTARGPHAPARVKFHMQEGELQQLDVTFAAGAVVSGPIRLPRGVAPEKVYVALFGSQGGLTGHFRGAVEGGRYRFQGVSLGSYSVQLWVQGYKDASTPIEIKEAGSIEGPPIGVEEGATLQARVVTPAGDPWPRAWVRVEGAWFQAEDDGTFQLGGLEARPYVVQVAADDATMMSHSRSHPVDLSSGAFDAGDLALSESLGFLTVRGTVVDGDGNPVASADVEVGAASRDPFGPGSREEPSKARTDAAGAFSIGPLVVGGELELTARRGASVSSPVRIRPGDRADGITVRLAQGAALVGTITAAPELLRGLRVQVESPESFDPFASKAADVPVENGAYRVEGLQPGHYRLWLQPLGVQRMIEVGSGETRSDFALPMNTGALDLRVDLPAESMPDRVWVWWGDTENPDGIYGQQHLEIVDGRVRRERMPAGPIWVRLSVTENRDGGRHEWETRKRATLAAGQTLPLVVGLPPAEACGAIEGFLGAPHGNVHAYSEDLSAGAPILGEQGAFTLDRLRPGRYTVHTSTVDGKPAAPQVDYRNKLTVHVRAGQVTWIDLRR